MEKANMSETKEERVKRMRSAGIETNEMIDRQFIMDKNLSECIREIQILFDKWNLRPLERDVVIRMLQKYETDRRMNTKTKGMFNDFLGKTMARLGGKE